MPGGRWSLINGRVDAAQHSRGLYSGLLLGFGMFLQSGGAGTSELDLSNGDAFWMV